MFLCLGISWVTRIEICAKEMVLLLILRIPWCINVVMIMKIYNLNSINSGLNFPRIETEYYWHGLFYRCTRIMHSNNWMEKFEDPFSKILPTWEIMIFRASDININLFYIVIFFLLDTLRFCSPPNLPNMSLNRRGLYQHPQPLYTRHIMISNVLPIAGQKYSGVTPLFKQGPPSEEDNYSLISALTSVGVPLYLTICILPNKANYHL